MSASVAVDTPAVDMPHDRLEQAVELALGLAWNNNVTITVVGEKNQVALLCPYGDCFMRPGVVLVVPDVDLIQLGHAPEGSHVLEREDGRSAAIFPGVAR